MRLNRSSPKIKHQAIELRRQQTPAEQRLWAALRNSQLDAVHFRRSHAIGRYVADFCSPRYKLVIELDGEPHLHQQEADAERTAVLRSQGYTVLRFWNHQVMDDLDAVLAAIRAAITQQA